MFDRRTVLSGFAATIAIASSAAPVARIKVGFANVSGGKVWWKIAGTGSRTPLLTLHGGPGAGHDYLTPLEALSDQRPVVLYDQLGCGRSGKPDQPRLWRIERFCDEIDALRSQLGLKRVILYGHSWGGWLAQEYLARRGESAHVEALILASTSASTKQFVAGAERLLEALPGAVARRLGELASEHRTESKEYEALVEQFYDAYLIHMAHPPAFAGRSLKNLATSRTYPVMNGPNEFTITGNLKNWDRTANLERIRIPTLVLTSSLDEFTKDCADTLHRGIAGSKLVVLPGARHLAMVEQPKAYVSVLRHFLAPLA